MNGVSWWRRPAVLGGIAGALVLLAIAAIVLGSDESEPRQLAVRAGTTTTSEPETTTTSVEETTTTTAEGSTTTTARRTATTRSPATTRAPAQTPTTARRATLAEPPVATMRSGDGAMAGARGSYCWQTDGRGLCSDSGDIDPPQALRVRQGTSVEIAWTIDEQPSQVSAKYKAGESDPWVDFNPPLPNANPTQFAATFAPGTYRIAVFSVWSQGDVVHFFKIDVYQ